jgi:uncharacterized membrane protein YgdD (TMEM256/DUF423 family)
MGEGEHELRMTMQRRLVVMAAVFGFLGVAIGAFGSHGLAAHFRANPDLRPTFDTASQYHLTHALAILAAAWVGERTSPPNPLSVYREGESRGARWAWRAGVLFAVGIVLFAGSLYGISVLQVRWLGAVAPVGGAALLAG